MKNIIATTDFSDSAANALQYAALQSSVPMLVLAENIAPTSGKEA